ncbi:MAG: chemotaxis protein CheW [Desulfuromonas sp.]|nr:MAG: chemotaxis protein CheW [Desulfuromonas sp.]
MQGQFLCSEDHSRSQEMTLVHLRVADCYFALDIRFVCEIIRVLPVTPVPKAPPFIDGIVTLRKAVLPVVDLRRRFGFSPEDRLPRQRMLICTVEGRMVVLIADEVIEVRNCPLGSVQSPPFPLSGDTAEFFPGVCPDEKRLLLLLDPRRLLTSRARVDGQRLQQQISSSTVATAECVTYDH